MQAQAQHIGSVTVKRNDLFAATHQWDETGAEDLATTPTTEQLILRNYTLLERYITEVMTWRANAMRRILSESNTEPRYHNRKNRKTEINDPTTLPPNSQLPSSHLDTQARYELLDFVRTIASMYNDVQYHKFEHATHVAESTDRIFSLITAAYASSTGSSPATTPTLPQRSSHGVSFDPMILFAMIFGAVVHDVEHQGVGNQQLVREMDPLAVKYDNVSVAENNSIAVSFVLLKADRFCKLRECMFGGALDSYGYNKREEQVLRNVLEQDECRFRQVVSNVIAATDIASADQRKTVQSRWEVAYRREPQHQHRNVTRIIHGECTIHAEISVPSSKIEPEATAEPSIPPFRTNSQNSSLKRSIEIANTFDGAAFQYDLDKFGSCLACCANVRTASTLELIIQAADVSHTMQSWSIFLKWNLHLLDELKDANKANRGPDCTENWFQGQIDFFDGYVLPLARRLEQCKVFGVLGSLFYENAMSNRSQWLEEGRAICRDI